MGRTCDPYLCKQMMQLLPLRYKRFYENQSRLNNKLESQPKKGTKKAPFSSTRCTRSKGKPNWYVGSHKESPREESSGCIYPNIAMTKKKKNIAHALIVG